MQREKTSFGLEVLQTSFAYVKIQSNKLFYLVPRNHIFCLALAFQFGITSIVEVAMAGIGDDEQLLVPWHRIWLADCIISSGFIREIGEEGLSS